MAGLLVDYPSFNALLQEKAMALAKSPLGGKSFASKKEFNSNEDTLMKMKSINSLSLKKKHTIKRRSKKTPDDIRFTINSSAFIFTPETKEIHTSFDKLFNLEYISTDDPPWPMEDSRIGETQLGAFYPKIVILSEETGSTATFFLAGVPRDSEYWMFKPSKGTIMKKHKQLRGWILLVIKPKDGK